MILWIILGVVVLIALYIWSVYNTLVKLQERVKEAWSDITVQLKYRADLIPNVVEAVKGYAKHEKEVFQAVTDARSASMQAKDPKSASAADAQLHQAITQVLAVAENYPELKANENFLKLQAQLQDVEDKIQAARRFYNNGARSLNSKILLFPVNVLNKFFGFEAQDYFKVAESEQAKIENAPEVKF